MRKLGSIVFLTSLSFGMTVPGDNRAPASGDSLTATDMTGVFRQINRAVEISDLSTAAALWKQACDTEADNLPAEIARCEHEAGSIAEAREDDASAAQHYVKALEGWKVMGGTQAEAKVATLTSLGGVYRRLRKLNEAQVVLFEALEMVERSDTPNALLRATVLNRGAALYVDLEQAERARPMLGKSIELLQALGAAGKAELANARNSLGLLELRLGRYKEGERELRQAVALANESIGEDRPEIGSYMADLALALLVQGQYSGSETLLKRARFVIESRLGANSRRLVPVLAELGSVEKGLGKFGMAEDYTERALAILVHRLPAGSLEIVLAKVSLGSIYLRERKLDEAEKVLPAAVEAERGYYEAGRTLADGVRELAGLRVQQHAWPAAESLFREALDLYERGLGTEHPDIAPVLREYAEVLKRRKGSKAEVRNVEARARAIEHPEVKASAS